MEISKLEQILEANKITTINSIAGTNYPNHYSSKSAKEQILKKECDNKFVKICESQEDQIEAILEDKHPYTDDQSDIINLLFSKNILAIPLQPEIKEDYKLDEKLIEEAANNIFNSVRMSKISNDFDDDDSREFVKSKIKEEVIKILGIS